MADGACKDYKFGQKNNWRRAMWNQVLLRTKGKEKTLPILYLAGPQDIDREVACQKGVPSGQMIAIDRSFDNVSRIREGGESAIHADAIEVLLSWPSDRPVAAVLLDFCCGLSRALVLKLNRAVNRPPFAGAVIMVNFMRGRDADSNGIRSAMSEIGNPCLTVNGVRHDSAKHRALQFLLSWWIHLFARSGRAVGEDAEDVFNEFVQAGLRVQVPWLWSYQSGNLVFDSAVFFPIAKRIDWQSMMESQGLSESKFRKMQRELSTPSVSRKIAATLAVRTMRQAGAM